MSAMTSFARAITASCDLQSSKRSMRPPAFASNNRHQHGVSSLRKYGIQNASPASANRLNFAQKNGTPSIASGAPFAITIASLRCGLS
jgi:hypothetical protein